MQHRRERDAARHDGGDLLVEGDGERRQRGEQHERHRHEEHLVVASGVSEPRAHGEQGKRGEQLVRGAEQRPDDGVARHAQDDADDHGDDGRHIRVRHELVHARELLGFLVNRRPKLLEHVAGKARRRVERSQAECGNRKDEQRICESLHIGETGDAGEHLRKAVREDRRRGCISASRVLAPHEADGAQRDHREHALDEHAAITDRLSLAFLVELLRRGARSDKAMEAGDCATCDGDEQRREQKARCGSLVRDGLTRLVDERLASRSIESGVRGDEAGERRNLQVGSFAHDARAHDADDGEDDHAIKQIARQVVARLQENPYRSNGGDQDVHAEDDHPRVVVKRDRNAHKRQVVPDGNHDDDQDDRRDDVHGAGDVAAARDEAVDDGDTDEDDRDHGRLLVGEVGRRGRRGGNDECVRNDGGERGNDQQQRQVREDAEELLRRIVDVLRDDDGERLALVAKRGEQGAEIVHSAEEDAADEHPQKHGDPAEDCRLNRAVDRTRACDRREVMAEHHIGRRRHVIHTVFQLMSRSRALWIDSPLLGKPATVAHIADDQDDHSNKEDNQCVH